MVLAAALLGTVSACGYIEPDAAAPTTALPPLQPVATTTTVPPTVASTIPPPLAYVFPFTGVEVSYSSKDHKNFPAADVTGCGATVVSPIWGTVGEVSAVDLWDPNVDDPATRGGLYVTLIGGDGVRYYFAHLASVAVQPGAPVVAGTALGVMGQTGKARDSECRTHFGISRVCPNQDWAVRRGEVAPASYLDSWKAGDSSRTPALEVYVAAQAAPDACTAADPPTAGDA